MVSMSSDNLYNCTPFGLVVVPGHLELLSRLSHSQHKVILLKTAKLCSLILCGLLYVLL